MQLFQLLFAGSFRGEVLVFRVCVAVQVLVVLVADGTLPA